MTFVLTIFVRVLLRRAKAARPRILAFCAAAVSRTAVLSASMSTQAASVSLEQVLRDCFVALRQSPDHGAKWAELAAPLWITNVTIAQRTLLAQRSSPSETSAWSKFMALLGHESIAVPKDAWPTVEAELIARLAPDRGSSTSFTTPPSNKGKGRDSPPVSPVLVDIQPLPWRLFKKAELQSDGTGYRHFLNAEHGHVFA